MTPSARAAVLMGMLEAGPVEFATSVLTSGAANSPLAALNKPTGLEVGDVVFILQHGTDNTAVVTTGGGGGAWSKATAPVDGVGEYGVLHYRVIAQVDIDNAWSLSTSGTLGVVAAFRYHGYGANAISVKSSNWSVTNSIALTGFSKSVNSYGVLTFLVANGSPTPTPPTGFTQRNLLSSGAARFVVADRNADYVDGAGVTWTTLSNGNYSNAFLVEVTGS